MEYNQSSYIGFPRRTSDSFFISPIIDSVNKRNGHQKDIIDTYKKWLESPFEYEPDIEDFDLNKLKIAFKKSFPSRIVEQKDKPQSLEEQALYHLCQDDKDAFECYGEILEKKDAFNKNMDIFVEDVKKDITTLLNKKNVDINKKNIEEPLRFFLLKIKETIGRTKEDDIKYILEEEGARSSNGSFEHRIWEIKDDLVNLMKSKRDDIVKSIQNFEKDRRELNDLLSKFQEPLIKITSEEALGLKSSCYIEVELSIKNKIKSFCRQHLHSGLLLTTYSRLQSLYHIFQRVFHR